MTVYVLTCECRDADCVNVQNTVYADKEDAIKALAEERDTLLNESYADLSYNIEMDEEDHFYIFRNCPLDGYAYDFDDIYVVEHEVK